MKTEIYTFIGPASIGKTTFIKNAGFPDGSYVIVSRDEVVARVSKQYNLEFDDLYHFPPKDATVGTYIPGKEKYGKVINSPSVVAHLQPFSYEYLDSVNAEINYAFYNEFQTAIRNKDINYIIIDRVHLRRKERQAYAHYLDLDREAYTTIGVLFNFQDEDTLDVIELASKFRTEDLKASGQRVRTVSRAVQEDMLKFYEPISEDEFDSVIHVDTLPNLKEYIHKKYAEKNFDESGVCPYCKHDIVQLSPGNPMPFDESRVDFTLIDSCPSCKKDFIVHEVTEDIFSTGEYFTRYETEKMAGEHTGWTKMLKELPIKKKIK